jgi:hypothetical protein
MTFSYKRLNQTNVSLYRTKNKKKKKLNRKLTPSAPLLSLIAVDVEGGLSLPLFVLEYWLGVDILLSNVHCPCENNFYYCYGFFSSFVLFTKVLIDMHCSPSHGYSVKDEISD